MGADATQLRPTGPGDLVTQLNDAQRRPRLWPLAALGTGVLFLLTMVVPPVALAVLVLGVPGIVWFAYWEAARRTVLAFYEVDGPAAGWYDNFVGATPALAALGGAWRIQQSGRIHDTYQRKIHSGAGELVGRAAIGFSAAPPAALTTNIAVPSVTCGQDALLFLPDRVLVRSGQSWSDVSYEHLRVVAGTTRFIETGGVPQDGRQVDTTWRYVNKNGGPDRRFRDNLQLPVMLYGTADLTSATGLQWMLLVSRPDLAEWLAAVLRGPERPAGGAISVPQVPQVQQRRDARAEPAPAAEPDRTPFARPGGGRFFGYAGPLTSLPGLRGHDGAFAVVDVETTGFSPGHGDRVIEIAIARVDQYGRILDEYATLLNPDGRHTGAVFVHGITNDEVAGAPRFADVLGDVLPRLDGCVVVAHNAAFEERFLAAEFARAGVRLQRIPALCTLWLGQRVFTTPNHKLATLAGASGIALPDAHSALGDVRAVAALLPMMLARYRQPLGYPCAPFTLSGLRVPAGGGARPRTRAHGIRRGSDGWMASILARLPMSAAEAGHAEAERYLSCLGEALADGRVVAEEARMLAHLAGAAGLGAVQVAALNERFLESMREAAFEDAFLSTAELRSLNAAARALGVPDYFSDLVADFSAPTPPAEGPPAVSQTRQRRCGHCRVAGHYRSRCPELALVR